MKALVVGGGSIAKRHIRNLIGLDGIGQIFVFSKVKNCLEGIKNTHKIALINSLDAINVDFAIIANETHKHVDTALILAEQGIHLFIEKPISHKKSAKLELLRKIIKRKKITVGIGYNLRYLGAIRKVKSYIENNTLGKIYFSKIEVGQYLPSWRSGRDYRASYSSSKERGGGVALDLSHELDYMRYFFGDPRSWKIVRTKVSDLEIDSDDIFEGIYVYKQFICNVHMDYLQMNKKRSIRIEASKATLTCDLVNKQIIIENNKGNKKIISDKKLFDLDKTYIDELLDFVGSIKSRKIPAVNFEDGMKILELIDE